MKVNRRIVVICFLIGLATALTNLQVTKAQEQPRTIEIHAKRYAFTPSELTLQKGETVTLRLISDDVPHSLQVPGLKINSPIVKGHPTDVIITPESAGDFKGKCGRFCGSGHGSMIFNVHVKD